MRNGILIVLALVLFSQISAVFTTQVNFNDYVNYTPGRWIKYDVYPITGTWNESTGALDILTRGNKLKTEVISFGTKTCEKFSGQLYNSYYHAENVPSFPQNNWASLQTLPYTFEGKEFIGEGVDQNGWVKVPPEAIISKNLVVGEVIDSPSTTVYESCSSDIILSNSFHWKYRTVSHHTTWGSFGDTYRTSLREYGGNVYNYAWTYGVGLSDFWHGLLNTSNNTVNGYEYYAVSFGTVTPTPAPTYTITTTPTSISTPSLTPSITLTPTPFSPTSTEETPFPNPTQTPTSSIVDSCMDITGGKLCFYPYTTTPNQ